VTLVARDLCEELLADPARAGAATAPAAADAHPAYLAPGLSDYLRYVRTVRR
jgi:hypothetical protein